MVVERTRGIAKKNLGGSYEHMLSILLDQMETGENKIWQQYVFFLTFFTVFYNTCMFVIQDGVLPW